MAHLTRCWCGKVYRCERDHRSPPNVICALYIEPRHDDCPDLVFHWHWPANFKAIIVPEVRDGATVLLKDLRDRARQKLGMKPHEPFKYGQLDIEVPFRAAGWDVMFDKPGFNESYEAKFIFSERKL